MPESATTVAAVEQPAAVAPAPPPQGKTRAQIAREMFGKDFHGADVPATAPSTEGSPPVNTEAGGEPAPVEEPEEQPAEEAQEAPQTAPEETGETPIASFAELVESQGWDPKWASSLKVSVNVDGTPTEATIGDLINSYQMIGAAEHRLNDAKRVAQEKQQAWAARDQEIEQQFQVAAGLIKRQEAILERDIRSVDPNLRNTDPAEWAARVQEFNARRAEIEQSKADTVNNYYAVAQARTQQNLTLREQIRAEQAEVMQQRIPEWRDPQKANAGKEQVFQYLVGKGFQPQELNDLLDARMVDIAYDGMRYASTRGQADAAKKKVALVPKAMKPGAPKPAEQRQAERLSAMHAALKQTGSEQDAVALLMARRRGAR